VPDPGYAPHDGSMHNLRWEYFLGISNDKEKTELNS